MKFELMKLPFERDALQPVLSAETLEYHYGKHHQAYVNNLNTLIKGTEFEGMALEEIVTKSEGAVFNNAAQVFNHNFYFQGMSSNETKLSNGLQEGLQKEFGSLETFKEQFLKQAATLFGSGWVWLCITGEGQLVIGSYSNADNPLLDGYVPLMTCDVWEHAYYIDYRNARAIYLEKWWGLIDWGFVSENFEKVQ
jgi:Fe-Mn family superoxide dismutase